MRSGATMTRDVVVARPEFDVRAAVQIMERWKIRHLPVVKVGRLVGIISDRDLLPFQGTEAGLTTPIGQAMTPSPITCSISTTVSRVAQIMLDHKIDCVPVVDASETLVGLVTSSDLLRLLVDSAELEALPFHYRLRMTEEPEAEVA
jgi:CBS domain-containing protein